MKWTFDQWVAILSVAGSWLAAIGTISAVVVALVLAKRAERVRLRIWAGLADIVPRDGTVPIASVIISVTNLGERPVTIKSVGWRIGKGNGKRYFFPDLSSWSIGQFGTRIDFSETRQFLVSNDEFPNWMRDFVANFIRADDGSIASLKTLRAQVHTTVGRTKTVKPDQPFLDEIQKILEGDRTE